METISCYILNASSISKTPSKVFVITTFYIFVSLNQVGSAIILPHQNKKALNAFQALTLIVSYIHFLSKIFFMIKWT